MNLKPSKKERDRNKGKKAFNVFPLSKIIQVVKRIICALTLIYSPILDHFTTSNFCHQIEKYIKHFFHSYSFFLKKNTFLFLWLKS